MQASPANTSNAMAQDYSVERLSSERLHHLEQLYEAVYKRKASPNFFGIKYNTGYTGQQFLAFIAYRDNTPIAYYGVVPCFLQFQDKKILAAQSADTMTHPEFRQQGIFVELAKMTFELCNRCGVKLIFGFPNQNFYRAAPKLNWNTIHHMACFIVPVKTIPFAGISRQSKVLGALYRLYQRMILNAYSGTGAIFQNSVVTDGYCGVLRDEHYLKAKEYYSRTVINKGKVKAWCRISNDLMVGDIELANEDIKPVIKKLRTIAAVLGLKQIQLHSSDGTTLHRALANLYPSIASFPVIIQDFGAGISYEQIKFTLADIDIF